MVLLNTAKLKLKEIKRLLASDFILDNLILDKIKNYIRKHEMDLVGSKQKDGHKYLSEVEREIKVSGQVLITKRNAKTGKITEIKKYTNLVTNVGMQQICNALIDNASFTEGITYLALGSDSTAATVLDTTLGTEVFRKILTSRTRTNQQIELSLFLTTSEGNGTHYELGLFGNGATATADSGDLFNRLVMSGGETKVNTETWTIEVTVSFVNS